MRKRLLLAVSVALMAGGAVVAETATAKDLGPPPPGGGGITVAGSPYRYTAMSPSAHGLPPTHPRNRGNRKRLTIVTQTDRRGGRVSRWWYLRGNYGLPGVAYENTPGGLSADGGTLVLVPFSATFPPRVSRFAILDTRVHLRHPVRPGEDRPPHAVTRVNLRGGFSFDAISPDGSTVFLIQHLSPNANVTDYRVRVLDAESGKLLPRPIVDPGEPKERVAGLPVSRANSPDGRWAYTLYDGDRGEPFIHALDTVGRRAVCIDLPQLEGLRDDLPRYGFLYRLRLQMSGQGHKLVVLDRGPEARGARRLLTVDTASFEIGRPNPDTAGAAAGLPWLPIGIASLAIALGIGWTARRGVGED